MFEAKQAGIPDMCLLSDSVWLRHHRREAISFLIHREEGGILVSTNVRILPFQKDFVSGLIVQCVSDAALYIGRGIAFVLLGCGTVLVPVALSTKQMNWKFWS